MVDNVRQLQILELLEANTHIRVSEPGRRLGQSEVTGRRDLDLF